MNGELTHYGVMGMKWGVRRGRASSAYTKAVKKQNKLDTKSNALKLKAAKSQLKATKKMNRASNNIAYKKALKVQLKANKLNLKSAKLEKKGLKWTKKMNEVFVNYDIKRVDKSTSSKGKKYVYELIERERNG